MTRAECIALSMRRGCSREFVREIRRYFNAPKSQRGFKWVYNMPHLTAVELPSMREKTFAQMAREAGQ